MTAFPWRPRVSAWATYSALLLLATAADAQLELTIETVALTGQAAPGAGDSFSSLPAALINDQGQVGFHSRLDATIDESTWLWDPTSGLELQSRASLLRIDFKSLRVSNPGVAHGRSETIVELIGSNGAGDAVILASDGAAAPGGGTFDLSSSDEDDLSVSNAGVTFVTQIDDGSNLAALFRQDAGFTLQEVLREGDPVPGGTGQTFVDFIDGVMNDSGDLAFEAFLDLVGTRALLGPTVAGLSLLLQTGDTPPGVPGAQFRGFGGSGPTVQSINNADKVAFRGNLIIGIGGVTADNETGIWGPNPAGGFQLIARTGSAAPEAGGATYIGFDHVSLNAVNSIAFQGILTGAGVDGGNDYGLWAGLNGQTPQLIAREGDPAPGVPGDFLAEAFDFNYGLNSHDEMLFAAELSSGGAAIWLHDLSTGTVSLLLGPGDSVEVGPGDDRIVDKAWFGDARDLEIHTGGEDGKKSVWNDAQQAAALIEFTDGSSGVFRLSLSSGVCSAPDGENLTLSDDTVTGTEVYEVCDTITVGPNYLVAGPNGDLTLRSGGSVALGNGTSVAVGGRLVLDNDPSL